MGNTIYSILTDNPFSDIEYYAKQLIKACSDGNYELVHRILFNNTVDANLKDFWWFRGKPLVIACENGHYDIAELLIEFKAEITNEVIQNSVFRNDYNLTALLISSKADINNKNLVQTACSNYGMDSHNIIPVVVLLIDSKADINDGCLIEACTRNDYNLVQFLINAKANPDIKGYSTPLLEASRNQNIDILNLLIEAKADPNISITRNDGSKANAMTISILNNNTYISRLLIEANANIDVPKSYINYFTQRFVNELTEEVKDEETGEIRRVFPFPTVEGGHLQLFSLIPEYLLGGGAPFPAPVIPLPSAPTSNHSASTSIQTHPVSSNSEQPSMNDWYPGADSEEFNLHNQTLPNSSFRQGDLN